jgi:carboxyl-terminal processing protease
MRSWVRRFPSALLLGLSLIVLPANAAAQLAFAPSVNRPASDPVTEILRHGQSLEHDRRWAEALTYYEESLRKHPGNRFLEERFTSSKLHYDLARRYSDHSFSQSLASLSEQDALGLYAEVLLKIQSHYVDPPNWDQLVERGTTALEAALQDPVFTERNGRQVSSAELQRFFSELRGQLARRQIQDRHAARDAAALAAYTAKARLGLTGTPVVLEYVCGATNALDDYSAYLTADQLNEVYSQIDGNFVGLGIELKSADGALTIVKVIPSSPAERGGLHGGDSIVAVDGRATADMNTDEAANLLQGPEGSTVRVTAVAIGGKPRVVTLVRQHVEIPSVTDESIIDPDRGVAYLKLTCFQKTTSRDLDTALWKLHRLGMRSLIMDLRGNPGGLLTSAVEIVDKFVESGTIVSTRGRNPSEDFNYSAHKAGTWRVPLVVLIDGDSASASEIFAGAMRDHRRAVMVGERSYGKGSVQGIFPLNLSHSGLRLTTAKFYSPNGLPFSKVGVEPDVVVHQVAKPVTEGDIATNQQSALVADAMLAQALTIAQSNIARK